MYDYTHICTGNNSGTQVSNCEFKKDQDRILEAVCSLWLFIRLLQSWFWPTDYYRCIGHFAWHVSLPKEVRYITVGHVSTASLWSVAVFTTHCPYYIDTTKG